MLAEWVKILARNRPSGDLDHVDFAHLLNLHLKASSKAIAKSASSGTEFQKQIADGKMDNDEK